MRVFLSWSGPRSHAVATALRDWLPTVIQALEPWMSSADIAKGSRWGPDVSRNLEQSAVGIVCLTPENLRSPWILFEAGALSKTLEASFVCPYLFEIEPTMVEQPLGQFQATRADCEDTRQLLRTINRALGEQALESERLDRIFERWWPDLHSRLQGIPPLSPKKQPELVRTERDLLEEVVSLVRNQDRRLQDFETGLTARLAADAHRGTFVLSPTLEELAKSELNSKRRADAIRQIEALRKLEAEQQSQPEGSEDRS